MLGIAELPEKGDYLACFDDFPEYKAAERQPDKGEEFSMRAWNDYSAAAEAPWSKSDYPLWAAVLERNKKTLNALTEGLQRPRFYLPLISPQKGAAMLISCDAIADKDGARYAMRLLRLRTMLRLHDGDTAGAWQDIVALYRMGRLKCQMPFVIAWIGFGLLCDGMAGEAAVVLSQKEGLTAAQAREFQKQLLCLPAMRSLGEFCNEGERCQALESLTLLAAPHGLDGYFASSGGAALDQILKQIDPKWQHGEAEQKRCTEACKKLAAKNDVDWTEVFRQYNLFQDRLAKVCGGPASGETLAMFEKLESETAAQAKSTMDLVLSGDPSVVERMSRKVKAQNIAKLAILPGPLHFWGMDIRSEQKRQALERMTLLAFALAGYRADHHEYPKTLAELVPAYVDALPKDPFSDGELQYKSENGGYLLYSVGENGRDDGGRNENEYPAAEQRRARDWDDISIRIPTKRAK